MTEAFALAGVSKTFGEVAAVRDVSLRVGAGTAHAVVGENGAGKSTLLRILAGVVRPDTGTVAVHGSPVTPGVPAEAIARGVGMVHQHFMLVPTLTVAESVALGPSRRGPLDLARVARELEELGERYGLEVRPQARIEELSVGEAQRVEILKVLWRGADVLVLDEPTAVLTPPEVERLFHMLRTWVASGHTAVLVSHKLDEVFALCERASVMRQGRLVAEHVLATTSAAQLVREMVGRDVPLGVRREDGPAPRAELALQVQGLTVAGALHDVSLEVRAGEVLAVAGVEGNGQTELVEAIAGLRPVSAGRVLAGGVEVRADPSARRAAGIAHVPEDRQRRGLVLDFDLGENAVLGEHRRLGLGAREERARALIAEYDVRPPSPRALASTLSGGNQQKLLVGRELATPARVLLLAQPTRGVDVGASELIHARVRAARASGRAVLLVTADLVEALSLADRILVLYRGRVAGVLAAAGADLARLGALMTGAA